MAVISLILLITGLLTGTAAVWIAGIAVLGISLILIAAGHAARIPGRES